MRKQDGIKLSHMCAGLSEAQRAAATAVDQDARSAILPYEIAAGRSPILQLGTARTENLHLHALSTARGGRCHHRCERACAQQCKYRGV